MTSKNTISYLKNSFKLISLVFTFLWKQIQDVCTFDYRSLAIFRIGLGFLILFDLAVRLVDLDMFHTARGILPATEVLANNNSFSLHLGSDTAIFQLILFAVAALFAIMLIVGYKTRLATIVSWILLISLQNRNPIILQGGDVVFRLLLFWGMFLPLGRVFSIDALKRKTLAIKQFGEISVTILPLLLQIGFIYFFTSILKTGVEWTQENSATYYALSLDQFSTIFGELLLQFKDIMSIMTFAVLRFEFIVIILIFFPIWNKVFRSIAFFGLIILHFGFMVNMHLGLFPLTCMVMATVLIRPELWEVFHKILHKIKTYTPIQILYNPENQKHANIIKCIQIFGIMQSVEYIHDNSLQSIAIIKNESISIDPVQDIISNSLTFFILKPLLFIPKFAKYVKEKISNLELKEKKESLESSIVFIFKNFTVLCSIMLIFFWNLGGLHDTSYLDTEYQDIMRFLRLDQQWNMFSPYPLKEDGWFVIEGKLESGDVVNLYRFNKNLDGSKPDNVSDIYPTQRWRKFMMNIWSNRFAKYRNNLANYYCKQWNIYGSNNTYLETVNIKFYLEMSLPEYQKADIQEQDLGFIKTDGEYETLWRCNGDQSEFK